MGSERVVTLEALRGSVRPVIVSGTKGQVSRAVKNAAPFIDSLRQRGVSVIPLPVSDVDASSKLAALKADFRSWFCHLYPLESLHILHTLDMWLTQTAGN